LDALLVPIGSAGDVHPFVGIGLALRGRGHSVTIITNPHFEPLVRRVGLDFIPLGVDDENVLNDPDLWHPTRGFQLVARVTAPLARELYEILAARYVPGQTVVAAASLALGARVAQDKLGIPTATVHLQPGIFRSVHEPPVLPGPPVPAWSPRFYKRFIFWLADRFFVDKAFGPAVNTLRQELGLPPVSRLFNGWWNSPQRVLGLFPDWFAQRQPDWPAQLILTGFPLYDERGATEVPKELENFLEAGEPPLVFTPGSANRHGRSFFAESVAACQILGRRGVLLTRWAEQVPVDLPPEVRHFDYAPFSLVLPRCTALVHHGGIGTMAQALAAGIPQLITPLAHDQFDNAARITRLKAGDSVLPRRYRGATAAAILHRLLTSSETASVCRTAASRLAEARPIEQICLALERLIRPGTTSA
jgi:rhamnosyltransferase subunit B